MIRRAQWVVLASLFLALAFGTGCNSYTASAPPGAVITVTATNAYQQNAVVGSAYAMPFTVQVTSNGTAVGAGVVVTFTAPTSGAGGTFGGNPFYSTTTNANGIATSTAFTANGTTGTYNVIAASPSTESTATFNCANTLTPDPADSSVAGGSPQSTTEGTTFNSALSVLVEAAPVPPATSPAPVGAGVVVTFTALTAHSRTPAPPPRLP